MNSKQVHIRVDSSEVIGTGHVMRCLTLATELNNRGAEITFFCKELKGNISALIIDHGFKLAQLSTDEEFQSEHASLLIIDHYEIDSKWEKNIRKNFDKILVIDDLANRTHDCDFLLDQNYYLTSSSRYEKLIPKECKTFLGPAYALLRKEFIENRENIRVRSGEIKKILVFFGGADLENETMKALKGIVLLNLKNVKVNVISGKASPHANEVQAFCQELGFNWLTHVDYISKLMLEADISIGAAGTTTWERCCMGLPSIVSVLAQNQSQIAEDVAKFGAHINLGWHESIKAEDYMRAIQNLSPYALQLMSEKGMSLVGGQGCQRIANQLFPLA